MNTGFTLLEVLLATLLLILLAGAVFGFYRQVLGVRQALRGGSEDVFAQRRILDTVADELQSAVVFPTTGEGISGGADSISFMRTAVPSSAVFAAPEVQTTIADKAAAPVQPQHDIQRVTYRLNRYTDENGEEQVGGLERVCLRTVTAQTVEEAPLTTLLSTQVKFIRVRYWDGMAWVDAWGGQDLPSAVLVALGTEPLPSDKAIDEYPFETVWRAIPVWTGRTLANQVATGEAPAAPAAGNAPTDGASPSAGGNVFRGGSVFQGGNVYTGENIFKGGNVYTGNSAGAGGAGR